MEFNVAAWWHRKRVKAALQMSGRPMEAHRVTNPYHARRAQDYGADAVIATGHEAAGHGGDATSLILIPLTKRSSSRL